MIIQIKNQFLSTKKKIYYHSFEDLSAVGLHGFFNLLLTYKIFQLNLQSYCIGNLDYYIMSGIHIMNKARSLSNINQIQIDGLILDTTWMAIPQYVFSILNACFCNSSIPIAFAFGGGEIISLYDFLISKVEKQLDINFSGRYLESDEGPALKSICEKYSMIQMACAKHFIEKLKKNGLFL